MVRIPIFPLFGIIGMFFLTSCQSSLPSISFAGHLYDENDSINGPVPSFLNSMDAKNADYYLLGGDVSDFGSLSPSAWVNWEKKWQNKTYIAYGNHDLADPNGYHQEKIDSLSPFQFFELSDSVKLVVFQTVQKFNFNIDSVVFHAEMDRFPVQIMLMHHPLFWDGLDSAWKPNAGYGKELYQIQLGQNFSTTWLPLLQQQAKKGKQIWCLAGDFGKFQLEQHQIKEGIHYVGAGGNGKQMKFVFLKSKQNRYSIQFISSP